MPVAAVGATATVWESGGLPSQTPNNCICRGRPLRCSDAKIRRPQSLDHTVDGQVQWDRNVPWQCLREVDIDTLVVALPPGYDKEVQRSEEG